MILMSMKTELAKRRYGDGDLSSPFWAATVEVKDHLCSPARLYRGEGITQEAALGSAIKAVAQSEESVHLEP